MFQLRQIKVLTLCGMLGAVAAVLGFVKIPLSPVVEIRFSALPLAVGGALFGPVPAAFIGGLADIVGFIAKPTGPYFPGFTISSAVGGVIYGLFLSKGKSGIHSIILANLVYTLVVGVILNTFNLYLLMGKETLLPMLGPRMIKEVIMCLLNILMIAAIMRPVERLRRTFLEDPVRTEGRRNTGSEPVLKRK